MEKQNQYQKLFDAINSVREEIIVASTQNLCSIFGNTLRVNSDTDILFDAVYTILCEMRKAGEGNVSLQHESVLIDVTKTGFSVRLLFDDNIIPGLTFTVSLS